MIIAAKVDNNSGNKRSIFPFLELYSSVERRKCEKNG